MTHEQRLDLVIEDWRDKLAVAEGQQEDAGAVALEDPARAAVLLQESATAVLVAQRAMATLEARRPQAQAADLVAQAADLEVQAAALEAQAAPIATEVDRLIAQAATLGVALTRRGDPQRDFTLLSEARSRRVDAQQMRVREAARLTDAGAIQCQCFFVPLELIGARCTHCMGRLSFWREMARNGREPTKCNPGAVADKNRDGRGDAGRGERAHSVSLAG